MHDDVQFERDAEVVLRAIAKETGYGERELSLDTPFSDYGIDSILAVSIVRQLENTYGDLPKTLLFEYPSPRHVIECLAAEHRRDASGSKGDFDPARSPDRKSYSAGANASGVHFTAQGENNLGTRPNVGGVRENVLQAAPERASEVRDLTSAHPRNGRENTSYADPIAVIGMSGRFPQAGDLSEFWKNLREGKDCITDIPERLWQWQSYWSPERGTPGRSYSKWGGFIKDADRFDPLFFGISNLTAEGMDPQERVFLEAVHHVLEDAGYTRRSLRCFVVGLYVGVMWSDYQLYGSADGSTDSSFSSIANRASYFFDLTGPSIALDATCSGSLTALHLACESLRTGESDLAVAGGVNITSHPHKYLILSRTGFASPDGRCRSFGADARGYVPGDGVGAFLLKRLSRAIVDGDHIHAVILGTAINHGGRSAGFTVPSVDAQSDLICRAIERAGIDPRSITYVEAHSPGTALGDPIEMRALTNAFRKYTADNGFCAIGSVKSNIGHLESAAGAASLAKVILQMQHGELVPSLHSEPLNPNLRLDGSPFTIQRESAPWTPLFEDGTGVRTPVPRRAAISAFGSGGANAHVIVEEYRQRPTIRKRAMAPRLIVLSAKTQDALRDSVTRLLDFLNKRSNVAGSDSPARPESILDRVLAHVSTATNIRRELIFPDDMLEDYFPDSASLDAAFAALDAMFLTAIRNDENKNGLKLEDLAARIEASASFEAGATVGEDELFERMAFTLQTGREAMTHRFASLVHSIAELRERLTDYLAGTLPRDQYHLGVLEIPSHMTTGTEENAYIGRLLTARKYDQLARLWCAGADVPWEMLYAESRPRRIPLPQYSFARERCWVQSASHAEPAAARPALKREDDPVYLVEHAEGLEECLYSPVWFPIPAPRIASPERMQVGLSGDRAVHLIVYPKAASELAQALKRAHRFDKVHEIILGERNEPISPLSWEVDVQDSSAIGDCVSFIDKLDTVYFLGGLHSECWEPTGKKAFEALKAQSVLSLFRLTKAMSQKAGPRAEPVMLKVITNLASAVSGNDSQTQPFTSGVTGFARGIAREYAHMLVDIIDIDDTRETAASATQWIVGGVAGHKEFALRRGLIHARRLVHMNDFPAETKPVFRPGGLYLLIGGAGAIGTRISNLLAERLKARIVWIGRSPREERIGRAMEEVERRGGSVVYISADASDSDRLGAIFDGLLAEHGQIDGVLDLAMIHDVSRIEDLCEESVRGILTAKADTAYALYMALRSRHVGFVALFSSAESYVGNLGWSAYAAACAFQDSFARYWAQRAPWPVVAPNWGYWEGVPAEVEEVLKGKGVGFLSVSEGAAVLERALSQKRYPELLALRAEDTVLLRMGITPRERTAPIAGSRSTSENVGMASAIADRKAPQNCEADSAMRPAATEHSQNGSRSTTAEPQKPEPAPRTTPTNGGSRKQPIVSKQSPVQARPESAPEPVSDPRSQDRLNGAVADLLSGVLKIDRQRIQFHEDLLNYGLDSLTIVAVHKTLELRVGTTLPANLFIAFNTIGKVADHLHKQYPNVVRALLNGKASATAEPEPRPAEDAVGPHSADGAEDITAYARVEPSRISEYLEGYGTRFRAGDFLKEASPESRSILHRSRKELLHFKAPASPSNGVEVLMVGSGIPVVLLPAIGLTAPTWRYQLASDMTDEIRLIVPHPPGFGLTQPIDDCTTRGVAGTVKSVIDLMVPDRPVHLVASCIGCITGMYLARFFPERIASLTLVGAFRDTSDMQVADPLAITADELTYILTSAVDRVKDDFRGLHAEGVPLEICSATKPEAMRDLLLTSLCANSLVAMRYLNELLTLSPLVWLPEVKAPTMCIYGSNDKIVRKEHSVVISAAIPHAELIEIPGAGHFPYLTHSKSFNSLIHNFIARHEMVLTN